MFIKYLAAAVAVTGAAILTLGPTAAQAADTVVTCTKPVGTINTGQDGSAPRYTIQCVGGSSAGSITFFAYEVSMSTILSQLVEQVVGSWAVGTKDKPITISSNLSDTSGSQWGCGASNCRIIDYVTGY